ncbi:MAG: hypothetical protein LBU31_01535 [Coriobacteriales bacterium]|nr:hypothetical protein [Coriobacteriales bacterium]
MKLMIKNKWPLLCGAILIAFILLFLFVYKARADNLVLYETNSEGLTYGNLALAVSEDTSPDLIAAIATNGEKGYIYRLDSDVAQGPQPSNPEEAVAYMARRHQNAAVAFKSSIWEQLGYHLQIEDIELAELYQRIFEEHGGERAFDNLTEKSKENLLALFPEAVNLTEVVSTAWDKANKANDVSIPVYKVDGKTVIGEFVIS